MVLELIAALCCVGQKPLQWMKPLFSSNQLARPVLSDMKGRPGVEMKIEEVKVGRDRNYVEKV